MKTTVEFDAETLFHVIAVLYARIAEDQKQLDSNIYSEMHIESKQESIRKSEAALSVLKP